jgi:hypothetical protein
VDHYGAKLCRQREVVLLQLDPAEVLALHSFLSLGSAIISGEHSTFSSDEVRSLIATVGESASTTLVDKLAEAVAAVRDRERLPKPPPRHRRWMR